MKRLFFIIVPFIIHHPFLFSQETFPTNGAPHKIHNYYAFTHAKLYMDYQTVIEKATLLIKDGLISTT